MAELLAVSQTSLMLFLQHRLQPSSWRQQSPIRSQLHSLTSKMDLLTIRPPSSQTISFHQRQLSPWGLAASVTSDTKVPTTFMVNSGVERDNILPDSGGSGGDFGSTGGKGGGGGGDNGGSGDNDEKEGSDESGDEKGNNKSGAMSMSQKLTLGYAILVGIGGVAGYLKSRSQKSLIAGGASAAILYYVYTQLPTNTVLASSIGLGCSAALLVMMGSRFKRSGKVFPAGVVSFVSFVMTGGYLHGIMRGMH
ncbi:hypothetical protein LIER_06424 [Lithospermum erythrorhizon]|uniref:Transmembrane protein 14 n=1 Tax=Lithospermum erythrorhizon TaxID=34254 RepID=A0AAV3P5L4_LITER